MAKEKNKRVSWEGREKWKEFGLLLPPVSEKQAMMAVDSRNMIDGLKCHSEAKKMLAGSRRPIDVARFIKEESKEGGSLNLISLAKYCQVYRRFFIGPMDVIGTRLGCGTANWQRVGGGGLTNQTDRAVLAKLGLVEASREEIDMLSGKVKAQSDRIDKQIKKENELGLPLPGIDRAMEVFINMVKELVEIKIDLGYEGYQRVPRTVNVSGQISLDRIDTLSPEEKRQLVEFGKTIGQMIEMSKSPEGSFEMKKEESEKAG